MSEEEKNWKKYSNKRCIDCGNKVSNNSIRCRKCYGKSKLKYSGEPIRKDGTLSKDKEYLAKKAWSERNREKDNESKSKWLRNNSEKRKEISKKWNSNNKDKLRDKQKRHSEKYPNKIIARNKARYISKDNKCIFCGSEENLEKHHPNYSKPNFIITLCFKCHRRIHNVRG